MKHDRGRDVWADGANEPANGQCLGICCDCAVQLVVLHVFLRLT